ncbi:MAG: response regulator [Spirochaetaceae bacterium]|nr:response regulator [Spirochaetaceae bacterium]
MEKIRVLLVDDQKLITESFKVLLETECEDVEVVGAAHDGAEAVELASRLRPDIVLMDVRMPGMDGVEATRLIAKANPEVKVIMLTTFDDDELVAAAIRQGAAGYLLKDISTVGTTRFEAPRFEAKDLGRSGIFAGASFSVRAGEIVGLSGLVGAGRTDLGLAIFGAAPPDSGQMLLDGAPIAPASPREAIDLGIGYLTEDRKSQGLFLDFPVRANLAANRLATLSNGPVVSERRVDEAAAKAVREYCIASGEGRKSVRTLSGGNQQKVLLGAWIGIEPRLLIVDEPTRGVDIGARSEIYGFLRALASRGTAIIMISSDLMEILGLSDRIYVMKSGRIAGELEGSAATEETVIALATGSAGGECE